MKYNKGFIGIGVVVAIIATLVVGGGAVYYVSKTKTPSVENTSVNNYEPVEQNNIPSTTNTNQLQTQQVACSPNDPRSITVTSPNSGEVYQSGQQISVNWNTCNPLVGDQVMVFLKSNQTPFGAEIATVSNTGSTTITLPTSFGGGQVPVTAGQYYKIRLELGGNAMGRLAPQDESDGLFAIN